MSGAWEPMHVGAGLGHDHLGGAPGHPGMVSSSRSAHAYGVMTRSISPDSRWMVSSAASMRASISAASTP